MAQVHFDLGIVYLCNIRMAVSIYGCKKYNVSFFSVLFVENMIITYTFYKVFIDNRCILYK
jgi:hypothetical protein